MMKITRISETDENGRKKVYNDFDEIKECPECGNEMDVVDKLRNTSENEQRDGERKETYLLQCNECKDIYSRDLSMWGM